MSYLSAKSAEELHAAVEENLRDATVEYYASYQVDAAELVSEVVPEANYEAVHASEWLRKIASSFGMTTLTGFHLIDPVYVLAWPGLTDPVASSLVNGVPLPSQVGEYHCMSCDDQWPAEKAASANTRPVYPVRLPFGARVIEILLCAECVERYGVEAS